MLSILWALRKWQVDLLGTHINIYTDHKTLQNIDFQWDLSQRQAWWMEYLSQYKYMITYINRERNIVANTLSQLPDSTDDQPTFSNSCHIHHWLQPQGHQTYKKKGYRHDTWCAGILDNLQQGIVDKKLWIKLQHGLLFIRSWLIIPKYKNLWEHLYQLAHDNLGHFGVDKSYTTLREDFYWPNMRKNLLNGYIPSCPDCQWNKLLTNKPAGPLHPLPVPNHHFESIAMDFIGPLPSDDGCDFIITMTDWLGTNIQIAPCKTTMTAEDFATLFFDHWYCENGCPQEIITDRDKLFMLRFWKALIKLTGINHKMSTVYHPQTDSLSEQSNKMVIQALHFHVEHNQKGWAKALPRVQFYIMNMLNASTGFSPFILKTGQSPWLVPPFITTPSEATDLTNEDATAQTLAAEFINNMESLTLAAKDNLLATKIMQAHFANKDRNGEPHYNVGNKVLLATGHWWQEYTQAKDGCITKFMPWYDGPYKVIHADPDDSTYHLQLPATSKVHPNFHVSQLRPFLPNNDEQYPRRKHVMPGPIVTVEGNTEYFIDKLLDCWPRGWGKQYLVQWVGYGPEHNLWLPCSELLDTMALEAFKQKN